MFRKTTAKTLTHRALTTGMLVASCLLLTPAAHANDVMTIINDNVGIGTDNPSGVLHILRTDGSSPGIVIETAGGQQPAKWEIKSNPNTGRLTFKDLNGTTTPFKFSHTSVSNLFRVGIVNDSTVDINGNLIVTQDLIVQGDCTETDGPCADYVFEADYELPTLQAVEHFINENGHLPNIPSAEEMIENGVNLTSMSGKLLAKVEELTLYTLQQEAIIADLNEQLTSQEDRLKLLEAHILQQPAVEQ